MSSLRLYLMLTIGCIILVFFPAATASALTISPLRQTIVIDPGQSGTVSLTVRNDAAEVARIDGIVDSFSIDEKTGQAVFGGNDESEGWVDASGAQKILDPGEEKDFLFTIHVPVDASPGGHYLGIFVRMEPENGHAIGIGSRVGSLLFLYVGGTVHETLTRLVFAADPTWLIRSPVQVTLRLRNDGMIHVTPQGEVQLRNALGRNVGSFIINEKARKILRGETWTETYVSDQLPFSAVGPIYVSFHVRYGMTGQQFSDTLTIWRVPLFVFFVTLLLFLLLIVFMRNRRYHLIFLLLFGFLFIFFAHPVFADTDNESVTVRVEVPPPPSATTPTPPPPPPPPPPTTTTTPTPPPPPPLLPPPPTTTTTPTPPLSSPLLPPPPPLSLLPPLLPPAPPLLLGYLCNGEYWNECPNGYSFFCPGDANPKCIDDRVSPPPQPPAEPLPPVTGPPPQLSVFQEERLSFDDIVPLAANRTVRLPFANGTITDLESDLLSFVIAESDLSVRPLVRLELVVGNNRVPFVMSTIDGKYYADIEVPLAGSTPMAVDVKYQGASDYVSFTLQSLPHGNVLDASIGSVFSGASVMLLHVGVGSFRWSAEDFGQTNPQEANNGTYGFIVPNGRYQILATLEGYHDRQTIPFDVTNNVVNSHLSLIPRTSPLEIDLEMPLTTNIVTVAQNISDRVAEVTQIAGQNLSDSIAIAIVVADNPVVEMVAARYVAPAAIGIAVTTVVPSLWSIIFPFLRYLFLQPLLLIGKKKREEWGQVYNGLTKLPIDLAIVRLLESESGRVVQTRVTDASGRYLFIVEPMTYRIEVNKKGFTFPSFVLAGVRTDGKIFDLYHGESIVATEDGATLTPNIPLDPVGEIKTPARILWQHRLLVFQHGVSMAGIVMTAGALFITPTWYIALFLAVHLALYASFMRYKAPGKLKGWGVVYDVRSKKPVGQVIARLFTKEYDKLVDSQLTDGRGRYAFLVGPNDYYITFEKEGYKKQKSRDILLRGRTRERLLVKEDVPIEME